MRAREAAAIIEREVTVEVILLGYEYAFFGEDFLKRGEVQRLRVGNDAVAIEYDSFKHF